MLGPHQCGSFTGHVSLGHSGSPGPGSALWLIQSSIFPNNRTEHTEDECRKLVQLWCVQEEKCEI